ncbi:MAG: hypothetical protein Sylvanvirus15_14 [Sylvanvirus sp.]|uniref:Uncharacterized protein n=1 Tax=Sylvanvirus sp. TaxID=2487774 RepID=A0A3G5AIA4_9VIRU|nr:MAG: hypothetical protein Sylvanvirus15_14 [Sylvanvirus sp.]
MSELISLKISHYQSAFHRQILLASASSCLATGVLVYVLILTDTKDIISIIFAILVFILIWGLFILFKSDRKKATEILNYLLAHPQQYILSELTVEQALRYQHISFEETNPSASLAWNCCFRNTLFPLEKDDMVYILIHPKAWLFFSNNSIFQTCQDRFFVEHVCSIEVLERQHQSLVSHGLEYIANGDAPYQETTWNRAIRNEDEQQQLDLVLCVRSIFPQSEGADKIVCNKLLLSRDRHRVDDLLFLYRI